MVNVEQKGQPAFKRHWSLSLLAFTARRLLALRYRITLQGLESIQARGTQGIVFLPNHPALIDPVIQVVHLVSPFQPRSLADEYQISRPIIGPLARLFGARSLPSLEREGISGAEGMRRALADSIQGLQAGENLLIYPAGHLKRRYVEEIGAASAVELIVRSVPAVRIVLVRQNGLWGSSFSFGFTGRLPHPAAALARGFKYLVLNGLFFMPRRRVRIEYYEPEDFPRDGTRKEINEYLEAYYNAKTSRNTYVPYGFWEKGGTRELPDPPQRALEGDPTAVPPATTRLVLDQLSKMTGNNQIRISDHLSRDLGMDSLATADLAAWLEQEFGFPVGTPDSLQSVGDVLLAANGQGVSVILADLKPAGAGWSARAVKTSRLIMPVGNSVTEVFLRQAALRPGAVVLADQVSGERSNRDLILGILLLKPLIQKLPGPYVGIMLPGSVGASLFYLAALFAGKTPVMINWTTGTRNVKRGLELMDIRHIITARALIVRLQSTGLDFTEFQDRFLAAEDLQAQMTISRKVGALIRSRLSWKSLRKVQTREEAVVLFTSGSESLPKAVPLTHTNLLMNIRDVLEVAAIYEHDALLGMLPPFHSFGLTATVITPLCTGLRIIYHANPNEAGILARLIESYQVTILFSTPTFMNGITRVAQPEQLASLRLVVTGAEKCPEVLFETLRSRWPKIKVLEGYGITECSPVVSVNSFEEPVPGSIGRLMRHLEGAVVSVETGRRVAPGEVGMLLVRGPSIFPGYLKYEGESPFVRFEDKLWYRTGDLVVCRDDGVLYFQGRLKRFVKLGGEMISLPAIESALLPRVGEGDKGPTIAVEALGSAENPEIVLFSCIPLDRAEVNTWLREAGLSPLHNIRQVIQVEEIPVLGTGKTDYRGLKQRFSSAHTS